MNRWVVHFSCGAASAVAAKLTIANHGAENVVLVNAFIEEEHADNRRFLADCERWLGLPVTVLRAEKYGASTDLVWIRKRFMKSRHGAPCSTELKRNILNSFTEIGDVHVLGYTAEEQDRWEEFLDFNPQMWAEAPLIERSLGKEDCLSMVQRAGLQLPAMYLLGFDNANCIGCPKGGQKYWQRIRHHFPERFACVQQIQEGIGPGAYFLAFRSGPRKGERMSLAELPLGIDESSDEPSFSCGFFCEAAEQNIRGAETRNL